jgi:hypothetical protein
MLTKFIQSKTTFYLARLPSAGSDAYDRPPAGSGSFKL